MKLTESERHQIKRLKADGHSNKDIADALGYSITTVYMVVTGREWSDYYSRKKNTEYVRAYRQRKREKVRTA